MRYEVKCAEDLRSHWTTPDNPYGQSACATYFSHRTLLYTCTLQLHFHFIFVVQGIRSRAREHAVTFWETQSSDTSDPGVPRLVAEPLISVSSPVRVQTQQVIVTGRAASRSCTDTVKTGWSDRAQLGWDLFVGPCQSACSESSQSFRSHRCKTTIPRLIGALEFDS